MFHGLSFFNRFGIDPIPFASMQSRNNHTIVLPVEKRDRKTLVASQIFERIEPDYPDFVD